MLAANKVNATSPNAVGTSLNMAQVKLATFAASDQVLFSSQGGNYTEVFTIPSGGSGVGTEITYANVPSETPIITTSTGPIIYTNSKSNIKVIGFSLIYTGSAATYGIRIHGGSNVTVQDCSVNMGGYGNNIFASINISNVLIDSVTLTNNAAASPSIYIIGPSNSNITVSNSSANTGLGILIQNTTNLTISNISSTKGINLTNVTTGTLGTVSIPSGSSVNGLNLTNSSGITANDFTYAGSNYLYAIGGSNQITLNRFNASSGLGGSGTSYNVTINDSHLSNTSFGFIIGSGAHDITYNNCTVDHSSGNGFLSNGDSYNIMYNNCTATYSSNNGFQSTDTSHDITHNNCVSDHNLSIGFVALGSASNVTYWYSEASYNGTVNVVFNGAGFLPHENATNVRCYYCIAHHNYTDGIGDVSTGINLFYNTITWANGYAIGDTFNGSVVTTPSTRGNIYMSGNKSAGSVTIKNTISGQGKPREMDSAANSAYTILDNNLYYPLDNNKFFSTDELNNISWATYHSTNEAHSQNANPLFADALNGNFILQAGSPAIDAGVNLGLTRDFVGTGVPQGSAPDIGAYEFTTAVASTSTTTTTSSTSSPSAPVCNDTKPASSPNLFQIDITSSSARLYFAPAHNPVGKYFISYGLTNTAEGYGVEYNQGSSTGVLSYTINLLKPNTTYYFKVRGGNGCMTGDWSGTLGVKTTSSKFTNKSFYLWDCLNGKTNPLACIK